MNMQEIAMEDFYEEDFDIKSSSEEDFDLLVENLESIFSLNEGKLKDIWTKEKIVSTIRMIRNLQIELINLDKYEFKKIYESDSTNKITLCMSILMRLINKCKQGMKYEKKLLDCYNNPEGRLIFDEIPNEFISNAIIDGRSAKVTYNKKATLSTCKMHYFESMIEHYAKSTKTLANALKKNHTITEIQYTKYIKRIDKITK